MSDYPPTGLAESVRALPEWIQLGCGDAEYVCAEKNATFLGGNMPDKLPDLSNHSSFFAEVMRENPGLYDKLKTKNTKLGVTFGHCIKTGIDNPGHPMIKTVGAVAGDEESYELFREFFDPVISARHGGYAADAKHPTDMNPGKYSKTNDKNYKIRLNYNNDFKPTSPRPQSIQLASTSSPPDAELAVPSVVPDSHHAAHSKKDVNSNVLSSRVLWVLKVTLRVTISHSTATAHTLPSQPVCPWKRKKNSAPTVTSSK